jgi:hypothetical protein
MTQSRLGKIELPSRFGKPPGFNDRFERQQLAGI